MTDEDELACILWDYGINSHNHIKVCTHDCCRVGVLPHVHASAVARCAECRAVFERQEWKLVMVTAKAQANACSVSVSLGVNVWCSAMRTEMTHTHTHKSVLCNVEAWQPSSFSFPCLSVSFFLPSFLSFVVWGGGRRKGAPQYRDCAVLLVQCTRHLPVTILITGSKGSCAPLFPFVLEGDLGVPCICNRRTGKDAKSD